MAVKNRSSLPSWAKERPEMMEFAGRFFFCVNGSVVHQRLPLIKAHDVSSSSPLLVVDSCIDLEDNFIVIGSHGPVKGRAFSKSVRVTHWIYQCHAFKTVTHFVQIRFEGCAIQRWGMALKRARPVGVTNRYECQSCENGILFESWNCITAGTGDTGARDSMCNGQSYHTFSDDSSAVYRIDVESVSHKMRKKLMMMMIEPVAPTSWKWISTTGIWVYVRFRLCEVTEYFKLFFFYKVTCATWKE